MSIAISRIKLLTSIGLALAIIFGQTPLQAFAVEERSNYLVIVKPGTDIEVRKAIASLGERPLDELDFVLDGFTLNLTLADANALAADSNVLEVIPDSPVQLFGTDEPAASWGLDRIDQAQTALDGKYNFPDSAGAGVRVYVVDTGVQLDNPEFAGRTLPGFDATGSGNTTTDCHGHATHVAGTAAGTKYGVAKKATIISVKVLNCAGSGSMTGVVSGLDWIAANHPAGTPAVVNMSIGGGSNSTLNNAVEKLTTLGILSVVAAGNDNNNACFYSPASATSALTVGASDSRDAKASFSNYGDCVDVFAPGTSITSARASDPNGVAQMSGTSMATPHVAGLAALYLGQNPTSTPAQATNAIRSSGILNAINNAQSANGNILINNNFTRGLPAPGPNPNPVLNSPDAPTGLTLVSATSNSATVRWEAPRNDGGTPVTGYRVLYKLNGTLFWSSIGVGGSTELTISPLTSGTVYQIKVGAYNSVGSGLYSSEIKASTQVGIPGAPEEITYIAGPTMVQLNWKAPNGTVGGAVTNYVVQQLQGTSYTTVATPASTSTLISGLATGESYGFRVFAQNASGMSASAAAVTAKTSATNIPAPQNVVVSAPTATGATLNWDAVTSPSAMSITSYLVTASPAAGGPVVTFSSSSNSIVLSGLASSSSYSVTVSALINQVIGVASNPVTLNTANNVPSAPQSLRPNYSATLTYLIWNAPASTGGSSITGYVVQKLVNSKWEDAINAPSRTVLIPNLLIGQSETYRVVAKNINGLGVPSASLVLAGRAALPGVPLELSAGPIDVNSKFTLTWKVPETDGGAAITSYQVYVNKGSANVWEAVASPATNSLLTFAPVKGATWKYRVAARNSTGMGSYSAEISVSTPKGVPTSPTVTGTLTGTDEITIRWVAPFDNGGEAITGYLVEKTVDNVWTEVGISASDVRTYIEKRGGPGLRTSYRVTAINSLGSSPVSSVVTVQVPYDKADAPIGVTATLDTTLTKVTVTWQAPEKTGGSPISTYYIQISRDGGTVWSTAGSTNTAGRSLVVSAPAKGTAAKYRVVGYTLAAYGNYSPSVSIDVPTTAPGAPAVLTSKVNAEGNLVATWRAPTDNGGSAITGYKVERLILGNWSLVETVAKTEITISKEAPGSVVELRVSAINAVGVSAVATIKSNFPYVQSEAVVDLKVAVSGSTILLSWSAPKSSGGAPVANYIVERSSNGGTTWSLVSYVRTGTTFSSPVPLKGQGYKFRVYASTLFGKGVVSETDLISTALTVSSAPAVSSAGFAVDGTYNLNWRKPSDNGGTEITGYVVEKLVAGVWSKLAEVGPTVLTLNMARDLPGATVAVRVLATNAVGISAPSSQWTYKIPALRASAPRDLSVSVSGSTAVRISWLAPESLGGSTLSRYEVQASRDGGSTWASYYASATSLSLTLTGPGKGLTWQYRVMAYTSGAGLSEPSTVVSFTKPLTTSSPVSYVNGYKSTNAVVLNFRAPTDLGGYPAVTYIVQKQVAGAWVSEVPILQLDGTTMTRHLTLPPKGITYYQVIAVNGSGQSAPVVVRISY